MLNGTARTAMRATLKKFAIMVRELLTAPSAPKEGLR
jgi:hypothetical protein